MADPTSLPSLLADDPWDRELAAHVRPPGWTHPAPADRYDLLVLGGGTAGLVCAAGAAGLGARVALVEQHLLGGDCLNVGCVPSKSLLRAARVARDLESAAALGWVVEGSVRPDFARVMARVRRVRAEIAPHDGAARFRELGVDVFLGRGRFSGPDRAEVDGRVLRFRKAVIATGARPARPDVPGLEEAGYLTNETVFTLTELPRRWAVVGGGPIGCELAQAFRRFGSEVWLLHDKAHVLDREDADAAAVVQARLAAEGVRLELGARLVRAGRSSAGRRLEYAVASGGAPRTIEVDAILVGAGRVPNVEGLGLEAAGVELEPGRGVRVDDRLRTTNRRVFAAGDVASPWKFTHAADAAARLVIQNALFFGRRRASALVIPRATYTDPEIASVGLGADEARERGLAVRTYTRELAQVDRARAEGDTEGFVRVHVSARGDRILGATVVARHAGDLIAELALAMTSGLGLGRVGATVHPYPTLAEAFRQVADQHARTRLTPGARRLLSLVLRASR